MSLKEGGCYIGFTYLAVIVCTIESSLEDPWIVIDERRAYS